MLEGADLRGTNLAAARLDAVELVDPSGARTGRTRPVNLHAANLSGVDLRLVSLKGIDLSGVNLSGCNLAGARLARALFVLADLSGANLSGADLRRADFRGADLSRADLSDTRLILAEIGPSGGGDGAREARPTSLKGANLRAAGIAGAKKAKRHHRRC